MLSSAESTAHARPTGWEYADCNHGEGLISAATTVGVDRWRCVTEKTDSSAVRYVADMVYDPDWDSGDTGSEPLCDGEPYRAFGISYDSSDTETDRFYCDFDPSDEEEAWLVGNDERDELYFHFPGNPEYNLSDGDGITIGKMFGNGDGDDVHVGDPIDGAESADGGSGGTDYDESHRDSDPTCEASLAFDAPPACPTDPGFSYL